ncbi:SDR family oxidoreductase [Nonomuraea sp. 3N208]|uniref:SDR family oxidoreductase n=1 Tax=Nonomuraea sp. 3N208 TaxID=3457421 RepID=UPI003FD01E49
MILNTSTAAEHGAPAFGVFSASKAAVRSFARTWANELKGRGIRVNAISPGAIDTSGIIELFTFWSGSAARRARAAPAGPCSCTAGSWVVAAVITASRSAGRAGLRWGSGRDSQVRAAPRAVAWMIWAARSSSTRSRPATARRWMRSMRSSRLIRKTVVDLAGSPYISAYSAGGDER